MQFGFANAHHRKLYRNLPTGKIGRGFRVGELRKIWRFSFCIFATAEAKNFKFGTVLAFVKAHHEKHIQRKSGRGPG